MAEENAMREIGIDKVTLNIGVGKSGQPLENAKALLVKLSGGLKPVATAAKVRNPIFKIKKGDLIGAKVTMRGPKALEFLKNALKVTDNKMSGRAFDKNGNFSLGVKEYIEFPGMKYDPKIGMVGFDVCVTLKRKGGSRVAKRRRGRAIIGKSHRITKEESVAFAQQKLNVELS
jgi:large subunit ribosomal protein L5